MTPLESVVERELLYGGVDDVPYAALAEVYREKLKTEKDPQRREELQLSIVLLLGIIDMQNKLDTLIIRLSA